jgi:hypothetical protein
MTTKRVVRVAIIAALYVVLTLGIAPLSYGVIQFCISEILKIFVLLPLAAQMGGSPGYCLCGYDVFSRGRDVSFLRFITS